MRLHLHVGDSPDGVVVHAQTARQVQLLQLTAALGHLLHRLVGHVGVDGHGERAQRSAAARQVADGLVLQLPTGGQVHRAQAVPAVVSQAAQRQTVHPLAVGQAQVLQAQTAERHSHQRMPAQAQAAAHVHPLQVRVLANHREELLVGDPIRAVVDGQVLEHFVVTQHGAKGLLWDVGPKLQGEGESIQTLESNR